MGETIAKLVFEFAGSNANIINNLVGHSISVDNKKCGNGSGKDGALNLAVVGAEIVSGGSNLISELDYTDIGDKFAKWAKVAGRANAAFAIISVGIKMKDSNKPWHQTLTSGDLLTISGAVLGAAATLAGAPVLLGTAAAAVSMAGMAWTFYDLIHNGYPSCPIEPDPNYKKLPRSNKAHGYDPLILNLDGKGIQTIAPSSISARFDHNADGIATATGWAAAGNGILALDLDKNGKIDSGKEIFGNHSVLSNGATAAHGYAALAELDSNHDNLINQADELFSSLKVWQDINQDGISQSNELFTLQALGIQSLNLEHQENSKDLGNGNRLTHIGNYTKTDGTTGEMGDVEFAANRLYSRYTDTIELTPEQLKAPNLQGLGRLRDLRSITLN